MSDRDPTRAELAPPTTLPTRRPRGRRLIGALSLALLWPLAAPGAEVADSAPLPTVPFEDQFHTAWTIRDGLPSHVWDLAQTRDGLLWLATESGLARFDGVAFTPYRPPPGQQLLGASVAAVFGTADGGLWVSYSFGGASFIKDGKLVNYPLGGKFKSSIQGFVEDKDGAVWGAGHGGAFRFDGHAWQPVGADWNLPLGVITDAQCDADGTLYFRTGDTFEVMARGTHRFEPLGRDVEAISFLDKSTALAAEKGHLFLLHRSAPGHWAKSDDSPDVKIDAQVDSLDRSPDGAVWIGNTSGIHRIKDFAAPASPASGRIEGMSAAQGLSGHAIVKLLFDREGDTWTLTPDGIDRFRKSTLSTLALPSDMRELILASDGAGVVVASHERASMLRVTTSGIERIANGFHQIHAVFSSDEGVLVNADDGLWKLAAGQLTRLDTPPTVRADSVVQAITTDGARQLWMSTRGPTSSRIQYRTADGHWTEFHDPLPKHNVAVSMTTDSPGRVWLGFIDGSIAVVDDGKLTRYGAADGLDAGIVVSLKAQGDHVWVGGSNGLAYFADGRFHAIRSPSGEALPGASSVIENGAGEAWILLPNAIARVGADDLRAGLASADGRTRMRRFDYLDGYEAPPDFGQSQETARTTDGRIYFASAGKVMSEGRDLVLGLLDEQDDHGTTLAQKFERFGRTLAKEGGPAFSVAVDGTPQPLQPLCASELLRLGGEAIYNAFRHADAKAITVHIGFDRRALTLRIEDDGHGIDAQTLRAGQRVGHLGLSGMRERAEGLGGSFSIASPQGGGTAIDVSVPAAVAYAGSAKGARGG